MQVSYNPYNFTKHNFVRLKLHICSKTSDSKQVDLCLGNLERASFVKVVLKLIDRGQYSKNESLAETVAVATSILSYVEPSLVLPFIASRFQLALETVSISSFMHCNQQVYWSSR